MIRILGIDPGIEGAWAIVDSFGNLQACEDMPVAGEGTNRMVSAPLLKWAIDRHKPTIAIVERVASRPGQGVASMFKFGRSVGVIEGVIGACDLRIVYVAPAVWKRHFGLSGDKEPSRLRAIETWPASAAEHFRLKKDHGKAEAALIALWGLRAAMAAGEAA